jgi:hypothetical protein
MKDDQTVYCDRKKSKTCDTDRAGTHPSASSAGLRHEMLASADVTPKKRRCKRRGLQSRNDEDVIAESVVRFLFLEMTPANDWSVIKVLMVRWSRRISRVQLFCRDHCDKCLTFADCCQLSHFIHKNNIQNNHNNSFYLKKSGSNRM